MFTSRNYTKYSYRTYFNFHSIKKEHSGEYGCRANKVNSDLFDDAYISVRVNGNTIYYVQTIA